MATSDKMKRTVTLNPITNFMCLNTGGNIKDNASAHLNKTLSKSIQSLFLDIVM